MPKTITDQQRAQCIALIPQLMRGEISKCEIRKLTKVTDGVINNFRNIAKFHSYELLVSTKGKNKEEIYNLAETCNLVELAYATGLCDGHIFALARKVIVGFRAFVEYRQALGHPLIKEASVQSFIPNEGNVMQDASWSTWNLEAVDAQVINNKGKSLRSVLLAHEEMLRSDTKEHVYLDIKQVKDLNKYKTIIAKDEVKYDFDKNKSDLEKLVDIAKSSNKVNAVQVAKDLGRDVSSIRCDLRFIKLHGADELLKYGKRHAPKRYDIDTMKSILCFKNTFNLSQEFVAFVFKFDRGEIRRFQVSQGLQDEGFAPIFPNIPPSTNIELFMAELKKATKLSDPYDILDMYYRKNGLSVPDYHKRGNLSQYTEAIQSGEEAGLFCPKTAIEHPFYIGPIDHETRESVRIDDLITSISSDSFDCEVSTELPERRGGRAARGSAMKRPLREKIQLNKELTDYINEQKMLVDKCGPLPDKFNYKKQSTTTDENGLTLNNFAYPVVQAQFNKQLAKSQASAKSSNIVMIVPNEDWQSYHVVYNTVVTITSGYLPCLECAFDNIFLSAEGLFAPPNMEDPAFAEQIQDIEGDTSVLAALNGAETPSSVDNSIDIKDDLKTKQIETNQANEEDNAGVYSIVSDDDNHQYMCSLARLDKQLHIGFTNLNESSLMEGISDNTDWLKQAIKTLMDYDLGISAEEYMSKYNGKQGRQPIINPFSEGFQSLPVEVQERNMNHFNIAVSTYILAKEAVTKLPVYQNYEYVGDYSEQIVNCYQAFMNKMGKNVNTKVARHIFNVSAGKEFYIKKTRDRDNLQTYKDSDILRKAIIHLNIEQKLNWGANRMAAYLDNNYGLAFSVRTVLKAMKAANATYKRKNVVSKKYSSYLGPNNNLVPNHVARDFNPTKEWQLICTDLTEVKCKDSKCYVAFWQDAFSGKIYNTTISEVETVEMVMRGQAEIIRMAPEGTNCIVHTDRGHQYLHSDYCQAFVESEKFVRSLSGLGRCLDNAMIESLNGRYKEEVIARIPAEERTIARVIEATKKWMEHYNKERPNSRCGGLAPDVFLAKHNKQKKSADGAN